MRSTLENFLKKWLPRPGIVACAIRLPDRSLISRRDGNALTPAQVEQTLTRLAMAAHGLKNHRFEVKTLCWTFELAQIHMVGRPDGSSLAVFVENTPGQPPNEDALDLIRAFLDLPES